ncbi:MAG: hypothetical protein JXA90_08410 [Planctomycetes bacterium]|nr:hypothetical protein [Planctomycetota bacterium]
MQKELGDSGFTIIANHVQNVDEETLVAFARKLKINFTVTSQSRVDVPEKGAGIPRAFLFNSKGELVESGHPVSMKPTILDLVESEPHWLAAGREYTELKKYADALKKTKVYGKLLTLLDKEAGRDGPAAEEATYLAERIRGYGARLLEQAQSLESQDASAAQDLYTDVASRWKGHEAGTKASDRLKELRKDKEFQKELSAAKIAEEMRKQFDLLVAPATGTKIRLDDRANRKVATKILSYYKVLKTKYADTRATATIEEDLRELGYEVPS